MAKGVVVFHVVGYSTIDDLVRGPDVGEGTAESSTEGRADNAADPVRRGF